MVPSLSGFSITELYVFVSLSEPMDFDSLAPLYFFLMEQRINSCLCLLNLSLVSILTVIVLHILEVLSNIYNLFGGMGIFGSYPIS